MTQVNRCVDRAESTDAVVAVCTHNGTYHPLDLDLNLRLAGLFSRDHQRNGNLRLIEIG